MSAVIYISSWSPLASMLRKGVAMFAWLSTSVLSCVNSIICMCKAHTSLLQLLV